MSARIQIASALAVSLSLVLALMAVVYAALPFAAALVLLLKLIPAAGSSRIP